MSPQLRKSLFALHPDTNNGDVSKVDKLIEVLKCRKENKFHVSVGNKVYAGGFWWRVIEKKSRVLFLCRRKHRETGSMGKMIEFTYHIGDFVDMRCGPDFKFRMQHI